MHPRPHLSPAAEKPGQARQRAPGLRCVHHDARRAEVLPDLHPLRGQRLWRGSAVTIGRHPGNLPRRWRSCDTRALTSWLLPPLQGKRAALRSSTIMIRQPLQRYGGMQASDIDIYRREIRYTTNLMVRSSLLAGWGSSTWGLPTLRPLLAGRQQLGSPAGAVAVGCTNTTGGARSHPVGNTSSGLACTDVRRWLDASARAVAVHAGTAWRHLSSSHPCTMRACGVWGGV
jgi:hypothetical protein